MALDKPRVMIVLEDNDAITNLAGLLWLKSYEVYKASTAEECLSKISELGNRILQVVVVWDAIATRDQMKRATQYPLGNEFLDSFSFFARRFNEQ